MHFEDFLTSDPALAAVGTVFGTIWTFFRSQDWRVRAEHRRFARALRTVEAGVQLTYRTYVRELKLARDDGKLTDVERAHARELARRAAMDYGRTTGVDVVREVGEEFVDFWINKLVERAKGRA